MILCNFNFKMADEPSLLGLVDGTMSENDDKICGWSTNKIGGSPNWLAGPPSTYPSCSLCKRFLYLVSQIYCPLSDSLFHRVLYIFGCANPSCWSKSQSWKVLRCQAKDSNFCTKQSMTNESPCRFEAEEWCDDADDWGDDSDDYSTALEQCTGNLSISENHTKEKSTKHVGNFTTRNPQSASLNNRTGIPRFAPSYISVIEAPDQKGISAQLTKHEKELLSKYQLQEGAQVMEEFVVDGAKRCAREKYEKSTVKHGDKAFHKFQKYLQVYPEQCLRYQWNGTPVSMVTTNQSELFTKVPPCDQCGAVRSFELQLMPSLVGKLKKAKNEEMQPIHRENEPISQDFEKNGIKGSGEIHSEGSNLLAERIMFLAAVSQVSDVEIEFGTVMVFSCSRSCWQDFEMTVDDIYREEFCLVEADPDQKLFQ